MYCHRPQYPTELNLVENIFLETAYQVAEPILQEREDKVSRFAGLGYSDYTISRKQMYVYLELESGYLMKVSERLGDETGWIVEIADAHNLVLTYNEIILVHTDVELVYINWNERRE